MYLIKVYKAYIERSTSLDFARHTHEFTQSLCRYRAHINFIHKFITRSQFSLRTFGERWCIFFLIYFSEGCAHCLSSCSRKSNFLSTLSLNHFFFSADNIHSFDITRARRTEFIPLATYKFYMHTLLSLYRKAAHGNVSTMFGAFMTSFILRLKFQQQFVRCALRSSVSLMMAAPPHQPLKLRVVELLCTYV